MIVAFCLLCISICIHIQMAASSLLANAGVKTMAEANAKLALDLVRECGSGQMKDQNIFLGPYSITTALAMTCMGAGGGTAEEMKKVLHFGSGQVPTSGFESYLPVLQKAGDASSPGYVLNAAQRIFLDGRLTLKGEFKAATQRHFVSEAQSADFKGNHEGERVNINKWVGDQTKGKITDLLPAGSLNPLTAMVLVQALYFKGSWMHKFDAGRTTPMPFFAPSGKITVSMMQQTERFNYGAFPDLGCSAVELPYAPNSADADPDLSMLVVLPDEKDGLGKLEGQLTSETFYNIRRNLRSQKVELKLPKFSMESTFSMKEVLTKLGMKLAFDEAKADFSGMVEGEASKELYISQVFHKAVVEVNEEGTEAAAATAVVMMARSMPIIRPFIADHPFLFFILDRRADVILFSGRLTLPPSADLSQSQSQIKQEL